MSHLTPVTNERRVPNKRIEQAPEATIVPMRPERCSCATRSTDMQGITVSVFRQDGAEPHVDPRGEPRVRNRTAISRRNWSTRAHHLWLPVCRSSHARRRCSLFDYSQSSFSRIDSSSHCAGGLASGSDHQTPVALLGWK